MVQSVEVVTRADSHLIATGSSADRSTICIWEKPVSHPGYNETRYLAWTQTERALDSRKDAPLFTKVIIDLLVLVGLIWLTSGYWKPSWDKVWMMPC